MNIKVAAFTVSEKSINSNNIAVIYSKPLNVQCMSKVMIAGPTIKWTQQTKEDKKHLQLLLKSCLSSVVL